MTTADEVLAMVRRPETAVGLCLRGDLVAQYQDVRKRLTDVGAPESLAGAPGRAALLERLAELREAMQAATILFRLRAITPREWGPFYARRPLMDKDEDPEAFEDRWFAWVCEVVSRTLVDPVMSTDQVATLVDGLSPAQWRDLSEAAVDLCVGRVSVPTSAGGSEPMAPSEPTSRPPEPPALGSLAGTDSPSEP